MSVAGLAQSVLTARVEHEQARADLVRRVSTARMVSSEAQRVLDHVPTPREIAVLECLASGLSYETTGFVLGIRGETARTHARNVAARLGARNRTHAVATAIREGWIQ